MDSVHRIQQQLSHHKEIIFTLLSAFSYCVSDLTIFNLGDAFHPLEIVAGLLLGMLTASVVGVVSLRPALPSGNVGRVFALLVCNSLLSVLSDLVLVSANILSSPGDAVAVINTEPVISTLLSLVLLRSSCTACDGIFAILGVSGVLMIAQPSLIFGDAAPRRSMEYLIGIICSLVSATINALLLYIYKFLDDYEVHPIYTLLSTALFALPLVIPLCSLDKVWIVPEFPVQLIQLLVVGFGWFFGIILSCVALQDTGRPNRVSMIMTSQVVFVLIGQYIFFGILSNWIGYLGVSLIIGSCVGSELMEELGHCERNLEDDSADGSEKEIILQDSSQTTE